MLILLTCRSIILLACFKKSNLNYTRGITSRVGFILFFFLILKFKFIDVEKAKFKFIDFEKSASVSASEKQVQ